MAVSLLGSTLTLTPAAGFLGQFWVVVSAADTSNIVYQTFMLTVTP